MPIRQDIADGADGRPFGLDEVTRFLFGGIQIIHHDVGPTNGLWRDLAHLGGKGADGVDMGPGLDRIVGK